MIDDWLHTIEVNQEGRGPVVAETSAALVCMFVLPADSPPAIICDSTGHIRRSKWPYRAARVELKPNKNQEREEEEEDGDESSHHIAHFRGSLQAKAGTSVWA